jgi:hypothetical protein
MRGRPRRAIKLVTGVRGLISGILCFDPGFHVTLPYKQNMIAVTEVQISVLLFPSLHCEVPFLMGERKDSFMLMFNPHE